MKQRLSKAWRAFANIAIIFSFIVNCVLVLALIVAIGPLLQLKSGLVEPLLTDLDQAFQALGDTTIETTVDVDEPIGIRFDLPLDQPLDLDFALPINQETVVELTQPVPLDNLSARFNLPGGGGVINGTVSLSLPAGLQMPVRMDMVVPVRTTIPVRLTVPVSQTVPIQMAIPVRIRLGEAGLSSAVQQLRDVFTPVRVLIESIPDGIRLR
ncbi:MAG TPA: hypothetical protein EYH30_07700 [Anaerolineales bacterium]|nr:hypothetical protein [Anaerolineales bacterium]